MQHTSDEFGNEIENAILELNNENGATTETLRRSLLTLQTVANEIPDEYLGKLLKTDNLLVIFDHALCSFDRYTSFKNTVQRSGWIANAVLAWAVIGKYLQRSRLMVMKSTGKPTPLCETQGITQIIDTLDALKEKNDELRAAAVRTLTSIVIGIPLDLSYSPINSDREVLEAIRDNLYVEERSPIVRIEYSKLFTVLGFTEVIPENRRGLHEISGCNNAERIMDIVFVHGLGGDSWTTWMADKDNLASFWPNWIASDFLMAGIWTLGYAASTSKWQEESMALADRGNQVLDLLENKGLGKRPLIFTSPTVWVELW